MDAKHRVLFLTDGEPKQLPAEVAEPGAPDSLDKLYLQAVNGWRQFMLTITQILLGHSLSDLPEAPPACKREQTNTREIEQRWIDCVRIFKMYNSTVKQKARRGRYLAAKEKLYGYSSRKTKIIPKSDYEIDFATLFLDDAWSNLWEETRQVWLDHFADDQDNPARAVILHFTGHGVEALHEAAKAASHTALQYAYLRHKRAIDEWEEWSIIDACIAHTHQKYKRNITLDSGVLLKWLDEPLPTAAGGRVGDAVTFWPGKSDWLGKSEPTALNWYIADAAVMKCVLHNTKPDKSHHTPTNLLGAVIILAACSSTTTPTRTSPITFNGHELVPAALRQLGITNAAYSEEDHFVDIDGSLIVDKTKAILTLRSTLTDAEKWYGLAYLIQQLRDAQVASDVPLTDVFIWKQGRSAEMIDVDETEVE